MTTNLLRCLSVMMVLAVCLGLGLPTTASAQIIIDGDADDLFNAAENPGANTCGDTFDDTGDTGSNTANGDPSAIPCSAYPGGGAAIGGSAYLNGFVIDYGAFYYDPIAEELYVAFRTNGSDPGAPASVGVIGDVDADGDATAFCADAAGSGINEQPGISVNDEYRIELDFDCPPTGFNPEAVLKVTGDGAGNATLVVVTGSLSFSGYQIGWHGNSGSAKDGDLEIRLDGVSLDSFPNYGFLLRLKAGTFDDTLGEDLAGPMVCQPPNPGINVEKVVADVCAGDATTASVTVTNTGLVPLDPVILTDSMPAGHTYAGGLSGAVSTSDAVGSNPVEFTANAPLAPGASLVFSFDIQTPIDCFGEVQNLIEAEGEISSPCFTNPGQPRFAFDEDTDLYECTPLPAVSVVCDGPDAACNGETIFISATATNDGDGPADIEICVDGDCDTFLDVPSGATRTHTAQLLHTCSGSPEIYTATATATGECPPVAQAEPDECVVECSPLPAVSVVCEGPESACIGEMITLSATAANDGASASDIEICIGGDCDTFLDVPPGATRTHTVEVEHVCDQDPEVYTATATASGECEPDAQATPDECVVACDPLPAVSVVCEGPDTACNGEEITLTATATNDGDGPADLEVCIDGDCETFLDVPSGATRTHSVDVVQECEGDAVTYTATATADSGCPPNAEATPDECVVECSPPPAVSVVCEGPGSACVGSMITLSATATNDGSTPADIEVCIDGDCEIFVDVPAGETRTHTAEVVHECAGDSETYTATATASGECEPDAQAVPDECVVTCDPLPAVSVVCDGPETACNGETITLSATATNDGNGTADIEVCIDGDCETFVDVPSGATRTHSVDVVQECEGDAVTYTATATADAGCPPVAQAQPDDCVVECSPLPAVSVVCEGPGSACVGSTIMLSATATNDGATAADIEVCIDGDCEIFVDVPAGETRTHTAEVVHECAGDSETYTATATASGECEPDANAVPDECVVTCDPLPAVSVVCEGPETACNGETITLSATATNDGDGTADIEVCIDGDCETFEDVPSGATRTHTVQVVQECEGDAVTYTATATADTGCPPVAEAEPDDCVVECSPLPAVSVVCEGPGSACVGSTIQLSATATNDGATAADIEVCIDGDCEIFVDVPSGETRTHTVEVVHECGDDAESETYTATATATGECEPDATAEPDECVVTCDPLPAVSVVCAGPESGYACDGQTITLSATATNDGDGTADIEVCIDGDCETFADVPSGETRTHTVEVVHECEGDAVTYTATATADTGCPPVAEAEPDDCVVECSPPPAVSVVCDGPASACEGEMITLMATATNDGAGPADIEICIDGDCETFADVPSGETRTHTVETEHAPCVEGSVSYEATASAENECDTVDASPDLCVVDCNIPSVDIEKEGPATVQAGDGITYTITVTNDGPVDLVDLVITDDMCIEGTYVSASPDPVSEPIAGNPNGTVIWNMGFLASGASAEYTIMVTAGDGGCDTGEGAICVNDVDVVGYCGSAEARDNDSWETEIECPGENCPRSPGFWCQQEGDPVGPPRNGSHKFTTEQMHTVIACIQDQTDIFDDWTGIDDFTGQICGGGPGVRQAKRQFAAFMANFCAGAVGPAWNGDLVSLDPSSPVNCPPFTSTNIGGLVGEIDALLLSLEGGNRKDKRYQPVISCLDDINNGVTVRLGVCTVEEEHEYTDSGFNTGGAQWGIGAVPAQFGLLPAFPNPVRAASLTKIRFALPEASKVKLQVFDVAGRVVATLADGVMDAGYQEADLQVGQKDMVRGMYFYRMEAVGIESGESFVKTQKLVVLQ